jgi:hypothetical protein
MPQKQRNSGNGEHSPNDSPTHDQLQHIMKVGEEASLLLQSPIYNTAYQQLINQKFQDWLASSHKESQKRESLYMQAKGLVEVTDLLATAVEDAKRVQHDLNTQNDPTRAEQEYLNEQGFGLNFQ